MRLRRKQRDEAEVSTESLNDIMFFLLLFFLIVSTLANPNVVKLDLPKKSATTQAHKDPIILAMLGDRSCVIDKRTVPFEGLEAALIAATNGQETPTVVLNMDPQLTVQDLVDVLQVGVKTHVKMVMGAKSSSPDLKRPSA